MLLLGLFHSCCVFPALLNKQQRTSRSLKLKLYDTKQLNMLFSVDHLSCFLYIHVYIYSLFVPNYLTSQDKHEMSENGCNGRDLKIYSNGL